MRSCNVAGAGARLGSRLHKSWVYGHDDGVPDRVSFGLPCGTGARVSECGRTGRTAVSLTETDTGVSTGGDVPDAPVDPVVHFTVAEGAARALAESSGGRDAHGGN